MRRPPRTAAQLRSLLCLALVMALLAAAAGTALAARTRTDMAKHVGDKTPLFTLVTSQDRLVDYNRDYYGRHHLVLSFFPAAFTPI